MRPASSNGAMRIQAILGGEFRVLEFEQSTHSSAEAATAIGCDVAQIAKSMLFKAVDGTPVLVVTSGSNRVDEKKVAALIGQKISRADPAFVLDRTGFAVGGVPPLHAVAPVTSWIRTCSNIQRFGQRRARPTPFLPCDRLI